MALHGLFIGIDRFSDPRIRELSGCRRDGLALWSLFADTIPDLQSSQLLDENATCAAVRNGMTSILAAAGADDTVIVSFSSHGTHDHRLVVHDTDCSALATSTIDMAELADAFRNSKAKAVLCILDCCFSGGAPARVLEDSPIFRTTTTPLASIGGAGRILIAASGINEPALEHDRHGLLTYAIIEAFQTAEQTVSLPTAIDQVMQRVRAEAARQGYVQNPALFGTVEGGLIFPSLRRGQRFFAAFPELKGLRVSAQIQELAGFGFPQPLLLAWQQLFPSGLNGLQLQAVNDQRILDGNSLFVVAPTSSGKTFIGELAAAKAIIDRRKAIFLFPYRALTNEKYDYFSHVYGDRLGMRVIRCTGDYLDQTSAFVRGKYDLAVLTYEMYLSLSVANPATLDVLGLLVVDEVQLIADSVRGMAVELLLTNVLAARDRGIAPQIITLSAVIGGENGFDAWLGANKLVTHDRPVPLVEGVLDRTGTYRFMDENGQQKVEQLLPRHAIVQRRENPSSQDLIVPLVKQLVENNPEARVIVFRNNRGATEGCARYLADALRFPAASDVLDALPPSDKSTSSLALRQCLEGGTAFHNSHLSREERLAVEQEFRKRDGHIKALAATTTVAAGINTPASTVILAEHDFYGEEPREFTVAEYKNMAGRAGRLGYHEIGQSILLAETTTEAAALFNTFVLGKPLPLRSSFYPAAIDTWILRLLSQVRRVPRDSIVKLLAATYGGYLAGKADPSWHLRTIEHLTKMVTRMLALGLIEEEQGFVNLTLLGSACGRSSLSFESAMQFIKMLRDRTGPPLRAEEMMVAIQGLSELDDIHTPVMKKGQTENRWPREVHDHYGASVALGLQAHAGDAATYNARCKRAMMLFQWISGTPIEAMERELSTNHYQGKIGRGHITGVADATRFHLSSAAKIAAVVLVENAPADQAVDLLLRQLEVGLPSRAIGLLDLPLTLTRGEYLNLLSAGLCSVADVRATSLDVLSQHIGKTRAQELTNSCEVRP